MAERVEFQLVLKDLFSGTFDKFSRDARRAEGQAGGLGKSMKGLTGGFGMLKGALAGFAVFEGVSFAGKLVADMEQAKVSFEVLTGSADKAKSLLGDLSAFAAKTPFEFPELQKSAQLLLNIGVQTQNILPLMSTLGDLSGGSAEKLDSITLAYGKIINKGKASMEELNMLIEGGQIPIMQELAKMYNVQGDELFKMVSDGKVSSKAITQAFANMTSEGGLFYKMLEKQGETLAAQWSTIVDELKMSLVDILTPLLPALKQAIGWFGNFIKWIKTNFNALKEVFMPLWDAISPIREALSGLFSEIGGGSGLFKIFGEILGRVGQILKIFAPIIKVAAWGVSNMIKLVSTLVEWIWKAGSAIMDFFGITKAKFQNPMKVKVDAETKNKNTIQDVISSIKEVSPSGKKEKEKSKVSKLVSDISGGSGPKNITINIGSLIKENTNIVNNVRNDADVKNFMDMLQQALLKVVNDSQIAVQ